MSEKITEYPIVKKNGKAYYVGKDGYVYESDRGNVGRPKKKKSEMPIIEEEDKVPELPDTATTD